MGGYGWNWPNVDGFIAETWGWGPEIAGPGFSAASNVVVGTNPPFTVADFLSFYPIFGGMPLVVSGTITQGIPTITGLESTVGMLPGMAVSTVVPLGGQSIPGLFPPGTTIVSLDSPTQITLSQAAMANGNTVAIFNVPWVPLPVMIAYVNLASAALIQARWQELWMIGMCLYVAHYCTLFLRTAGNPATSASQLATQGLARGITIAKSAGGVSGSAQPTTQGNGMDDWGSYKETEYGVQLITFAQGVGSGPILLY